MPDFTNPSLKPENLSNLRLGECASGYRAVQVSGADSAGFLHGQLTADITNLQTGTGIPAALCTVQGRVTSTLDVLHDDTDHWLIIPAPLVGIVTDQLRKYVLRAKVNFAPVAAPVSMTFSQDARAGQVISSESTMSYAPAWATLPATQGVMSFQKLDDHSAVDSTLNSDWPALRVLLGVSATDTLSSNKHLPQMLNLDLLGAVDFHKGCYTGQEIIARTHFRGTVKRRMLRFLVRAEVAADSGVEVTTAEGKKAGETVGAALDGNGNTGILAVVRLDQQGDTLFVANQPAEPWELPYSVDTES